MISNNVIPSQLSFERRCFNANFPAFARQIKMCNKQKTFLLKNENFEIRFNLHELYILSNDND